MVGCDPFPLGPRSDRIGYGIGDEMRDTSRNRSTAITVTRQRFLGATGGGVDSTGVGCRRWIVMSEWGIGEDALVPMR